MGGTLRVAVAVVSKPDWTLRLLGATVLLSWAIAACVAWRLVH